MGTSNVSDSPSIPWARGILVTVSIALALSALGWVVQGNDFLLFKFFAPRQEAARREVFEQSKAYREGMAQELRAMQLDYVKASPEQKKAIASIVVHRVAGVDLATLPADVRLFVRQAQQEQGL